MEGWQEVAALRIDAGVLFVGAAEDAAGSPPLAELLEAVPLGTGVDLAPRTGVQAALVPTGAGDGIYPVEVQTETIGGRELVTEVRVRFIARE